MSLVGAYGAGSPVRAKFAAPIQTNAAIASEPGSGSVKLDWESGIGRQEAHRASQTLREGALQMRPLLKGCLELSSAFHFFAFECRRRSSRSLEAGTLRWARGTC